MARTGSITDDLRTDILAGRFRPGDRLLEVALTERFGCGRATARAALVELTAEGLVEREPNRGPGVRRLTVAEAIEITEARVALESLLARRAALNAEDRDRTELRRIIADMEAAVADGHGEEYSELNATLHRRIRTMSGHAVAAALVDNLRNRAATHQYRLALMPGRSAESLVQHARIVDAIDGGDEDGAAEAMGDHLISVIEVLRSWKDAPAPG